MGKDHSTYAVEQIIIMYVLTSEKKKVSNKIKMIKAALIMVTNYVFGSMWPSARTVSNFLLLYVHNGNMG